MSPRWARVASAFLLVGALLGSGACSSHDRFQVAQARSHVERLAGSIGSRPAGSSANEKARAYLIETLQLAGFEVRVQEADVAWPDAGVNARVANLIAVRPGQNEQAIALVAHYDSSPFGPGGGDDAFGTAVVLEAARVLAQRPSPRYTLMVLLTDGEELGLLGARALVRDPEVRSRLRTFVNLEAIGAAGPVVLFESGPGTSPALRAWSRASRPHGGSYMQAIYDVLPNDTDFTILRDLPGVSGVNLAATGDGYAYHVDRDRADRVTSEALATAGTLVLDIVDALDARTSLDADESPAAYVSLLRRHAWVVSLGTAVTAGGVIALLAVLVWLLCLRQVIAVHGVGRLLLTLVWAALATAAVAAALLAGPWLVRNARAELHPWFASPMRLFAFMTVLAVAVSWGVRRLATLVPPAVQPDGTPLGVWVAALPVWASLLVASLRYAPAASPLVSIPLGVAVLLLPLGLLWPSLLRVASLVVLVVTWILWVPDLITVLGFVVVVLERFPVVTPTWTYPAFFLAAGVVLWPPALATLVGRLQWRMPHGLAGALLGLAFVISGALAFTAPAYTEERPVQRVAAFVEDHVTRRAYWEISANEPGVDIGAGAPSDVQWMKVDRSAAGSAGVSHKAHVFRGEVPLPSAPPPVTLAASVTRRESAGEADVEIAVTPTDDVLRSVAFVLPEAIVPTQSSLAGRTRDDRWRASFLTLTRGGLTWRATVPLSQADRLAATQVWLASPSLPGDAGNRVPSWLTSPTTAWHTRHVQMLPITPSEFAERAPTTPVSPDPAAPLPGPVVPLPPAGAPVP